MTEQVKAMWLEDNDGQKVAPKTLTSQVLNSNGIPLDETIEELSNSVGGTTGSTLDKKVEALSLDKGEWNSATEYNKTDYARYNGYLYISLQDNINVIPEGNETTWMVVGKCAYAPTTNVTSYTAEGKYSVDALQLNSSATFDENGVFQEDGNGSVKSLAGQISALNESLSNVSHNVPRLVPKDITSYYQDGSLWDRLNGTNGYSLFEDIFVGDYIQMSRPISAYNQDQENQTTGSQYVTIAGINTLLGNGDTAVNYNHLVMVPGQGFSGTQHFGKSRMNPTNTTEGGYIATEMHTTTIGAVATEGSTETTATINQQLYAEFGSHLKTTREMLSNAINSTGYNRFGSNTGCSNNWAWTDCQAVLISEIEVFGSIVWSSSGYDTGTAKVQLPLFANNKYAVNNRNAWYWLKDIASSAYFCDCNSGGIANCHSASDASYYVRPRFVIAK